MSAGIVVSAFPNDISFGITVMSIYEENSEEIVIDNCFTDANFRKIIKTHDIDDNGILDNDELSNITSVSINGKVDGDVSSFEGIEYLTKLSDVSIFNCSATSLDLSKNTELCNLLAFNNPKLASLDTVLLRKTVKW